MLFKTFYLLIGDLPSESASSLALPLTKGASSRLMLVVSLGLILLKIFEWYLPEPSLKVVCLLEDFFTNSFLLGEIFAEPFAKFAKF